MFVVLLSAAAGPLAAEEFNLHLRSVQESSPASGVLRRETRHEAWDARATAVIVCDVWDYHHCLNAVRRLEEFAPRLDRVLAEARRRGATIIHSPSDCMEAYSAHPARLRALAVPVARQLPHEVETWCSRIPREERGVYPIDQSDGGEDDDPVEHAEWAMKLKEMGRNPGMPWKKQSHLITIDADHDFITDRGDEVWSILEQRGIERVILSGVHTNMCVLGRPFGLRQMVRHGKQVVLMRDMTDCMYNPRRWPYVDHFNGNDLIIAHVERFVCPTVTSDQLLGGEPFRSKFDKRSAIDVLPLPGKKPTDRRAFEQEWSLIKVPATWQEATAGVLDDYQGVAHYRCAVRLPKEWIAEDGLTVSFGPRAKGVSAWLNGHPLTAVAAVGSSSGTLRIDPAWIVPSDANLLVVRIEHKPGDGGFRDVPEVRAAAGRTLPLKGRWQFRLGDDASWSNIPLPARFGTSPDILFEAGASTQPAAAAAPIKELILPGESFLVAGRPAFILHPPEALRQRPQPWILYAPTLPGLPDTHEKWMHEQFTAAGIAVAGIDIGEAHGSPAGRELFTALYQVMTRDRGYAAKPCLLGRSRGGLWVTSWACDHPDQVAGIAGIYPVFDLRTYPGLENAAGAFKLTPQELEARLAEHNPIQRVEVLAQAGVPAFLIHGDDDRVVPLQENSAAFAARYEAAGKRDAVTLLVAKGQGHNYWEGFFRCQELVDFTIARAREGALPEPKR
ncbi:MAG: prolyl oligopeptidase family serine peptidase [Planctomycetales bacterium]